MIWLERFATEMREIYVIIKFTWWIYGYSRTLNDCNLHSLGVSVV